MSTRKRCLLGLEEPNHGDSNKRQAASGTSAPDASVPLKSCLKSAASAAPIPKRGKTHLQVTPTGEAQPQEVVWNERGQPVGKISERFSSTIGVIVREHAPLNAMTWHKVKGPARDDLWDYLMLKFVVEPIHKPAVFMQMGRLWRNWKSTLSVSIRRILEAKRTKADGKRLLDLLRPADTSVEEWEIFVNDRCSEAFKERSDKMKEVRAKQLLCHTMSREGYARKEHKWKNDHPGKILPRSNLWIMGHEQKKAKNPHVAAKIIELQAAIALEPPSEGPVPIQCDALAKVLGKERHGRVRGLGGGVTASKIDAQQQIASWKAILENKVETMEERYSRLERAVYMLTSQQPCAAPHDDVNGLHCSAPPSVNEPQTSAGSNEKCNGPNLQDAPQIGEVNEDLSRNGENPKENFSFTQPQSQNSKSVEQSPWVVNDLCDLLDWEGTGAVVARGQIDAVDPKTRTHGDKLGPDCYRVAVMSVLNSDAEFYRSHRGMESMEDALGSNVAWPIKYLARTKNP